MQLKIEHKSLTINGKPRKIYPIYPAVTKQLLIENLFTKFLFKSVYKRNTHLSCSKAKHYYDPHFFISLAI